VDADPVGPSLVVFMLARLDTIWKFRYFWMSLVSMDLRVRYRKSFLGIGWSLLNPIVMTVVFCVVFAKWLGNGDWRTAAPYYLSGIAIWEFVKQAAIQGSMTFVRNESYIRQSPLPLGIYTLRTTLGQLVHFGISLSVVLLSAIILNQTDHLTPFYSIWAVIPGILLLLIFGWAVGACFAFMNVYFHDSMHIAEVIFGIFFFLTPIIYRKQMLIDNGYKWLLDINPVVAFLDLIREPLLTGLPPSVEAMAKAMGFTLVAVSLALALFAKCERKLIFHL
jgi:lipopolysaccharide transport system permease protein